jgi:hypothetical protein
MGLLGLPLVIVRKIFEEACGIYHFSSYALSDVSQVYHNDIKSFMRLRLVSKACRRESERLLFRTLIIDYKNGTWTSGNIHILTRLETPEDTLMEHIRHLKIGPYMDWGFCNDVIAPVLEGAVVNFTKLQSFTWSSHLPIPLNMLRNFHEKFPSAQLHVINHRRFPVSLPRSLLSYPRLHTLDITVYFICGGLTHAYSEFQILKDCLIHGGSVKVLRLATESVRQDVPAGYHHELVPSNELQTREGVTLGPVSFHWKNDDRFPPLEELKLKYGDYHLSLEQCQMWVECMDWSKLRKLDLGEGAPRYLFESLTGVVPQLKSLTFGIYPILDPEARTWECYDTSIIARFLESISALEELVLDVFHDNHFEATFPVAIQKLGHSLKRLHAKYLT